MSTPTPQTELQSKLQILHETLETKLVRDPSQARQAMDAVSELIESVEAGEIALSEGLAAELRGTGVRVQALCPGFTHSEFHERMKADPRLVPGWMWLSARQVVRSSLRNVRRRGPVVCVPGLRYKLIVFLLRHVPRSFIGWAARHRSTGM